MNCPCGSNQRYIVCCGPFLQKKQFPKTAEQLMRSRYTAFVLQDSCYLLETWSKRTKPKVLELETEIQWQKLEIISIQQGREEHKMGKVHFIAYYQIQNGMPAQSRSMQKLEEISRFRKEEGNWVYLDGTFP